MNEERCPLCVGPAHSQTWRCESCLARFSCDAALTTGVPDPLNTITTHLARPVIGYRPAAAVDEVLEDPTYEPVLGETITCGPVVVDSGGLTKTERAFALATAQSVQRRQARRLIALEELAR